MIKTIDIAWLAGLLEGEGCFCLEKGKYPRIALGMCDEDVVVKAAALMKSKVNHHRNVYSTKVCGAYSIAWMMTLYTLLGERRREKVASLIKYWREHSYGRMPGGVLNSTRAMAKCHPDRSMQAHGLCSSCYGKQYRKKESLLKQASW